MLTESPPQDPLDSSQCHLQARQPSLDWPPPYRLINNARARRISLKISLAHGLEIVVPKRYAKRDLTHFLNEKRDWIEKHLQKVNASLASQELQDLPTRIELRAIEEILQIEYHYYPGKLRLIRRPHYQLVIMGDIDDQAQCRCLLRDHIKEIAKLELGNCLTQLSREIDLPFSKVTIRGQKTRWGSCSQAKVINLNYKLLFLHPYMMRHIMVHELCHTVHMNHSEQFWQLVARFDPHWEQTDRQVNQTQELIPLWLQLL